MRLVLLGLVIIGYCFDINSGCCGKENNDNSKGCCKCCGAGDDLGPGGGFGNLKSKKSVPTGGGGKPDDKNKDMNPGGGVKPTPSETNKFDAGIIVTPDSVTIKPVGGSEIKLNDDNEVDVHETKLVNDLYYSGANAYKFDYSKMIKNAKVTISDNGLKNTPYLIAIVSLKGDEPSKYILIVSKDDGDMSNLFYNLNITGVSLLSSNGITSMGSMFRGCKDLTVCNINIDTGKVTEMGHMFYMCEKLEALDLSCFNTSKVTEMNHMFYGCEKLEALDLSCFNTSEVVDMNSMFFWGKKLKNINFGNNFKSDKIQSLSYMFCGCAVLSKLDFKNFDISKIARNKREKMFGSCNSLNEVVVCRVDKDLTDAFSNNGFTTVDNKTWKKSTK